MYQSRLVRIALYLGVGLAARYLPTLVDKWVHLGIRDLIPADHYRDVVLAITAAMVLAELASDVFKPIRPHVERRWLWALIIFFCSVVVLWTLRVPKWFGDLQNIDKVEGPVQIGVSMAFALGAIVWLSTINLAHALDVLKSTVFAAISVGFGSTAIVALFLWARCVTREWLTVFLMMISTAPLLIFFGYVERATPLATALLCWYLYAGTRALQERTPTMVALSSGLIAVATLQHGSMLCWVPAHVWFVCFRNGWRLTAVGMGALLAPVALLRLFVWWWQPPVWSGDEYAPLQWIDAYCVTNCGYRFWTVWHFTDILSYLLTMAPVAFLCAPEAFARRRGDLENWLALGSLGGLFLAIVFFPVLGYLSDWDLFLVAPLSLSCLTIVVGQRVMDTRAFQRLAAAWIVGSALHMFAFWRIFSLSF